MRYARIIPWVSTPEITSKGRGPLLSGWSTNKKQAEQLAALAALKELGLAAETAEGEVAIIWPKH
jgi:hypothetical protein